MGAKGKIDEIVDIPSVKKQIDYLKTELSAIVGKMGEYAAMIDTVNSKVKGSKGMGELNVALKESTTHINNAKTATEKYTTVQDQLAKKEKEYASLMNGSAEAYKKLIAQQDAIKKLKEEYKKEVLKEAEATKKAADEAKKAAEASKKQADELKKLNAIGEKRAKAIEEEGRAYNQLKIKVEEARKKYLDLATAQGMNSSSTKKAHEEFTKLNDKLVSINQSTGNYKDNVGNYGSAWDGVKSTLGAAALAMGALSGTIAFGKSVIESTGATAREFKAITTGLTWAWDEFKKALATSDFSNLTTNMISAIDAGREYVNILADVKKSTRALGITNSELNIEFQKQKVIERDVSKTKEERIAAGKKALAIEMQMTQGSTEVAQKAFDAELLHLRTITKLKDADIKAAVSTYNTNKENLKLANEYNKAVETTSAKNSQAEHQMRATPEGEAIYQKMLKAVKNANPEIVKLAYVMRSMGKTTGEELDAMAQKWVDLNNVQAESVTRTARVKITLGRLQKGIIDEGIKEEENQVKAAEKAEKQQKDAYEAMTARIEELTQKKKALNTQGYTLNITEGVELDTLIAKKKAVDDLVPKVEKQIGAYQKLINNLSELQAQKEEFLANDQAVPPELDIKIDKAQAKLDAIEKKMAKVKYDANAGIGQLEIANAGDQTGAFQLPKTFGAKLQSDTQDKNSIAGQFDAMSSQEQQDYAIEQAQAIQDAAFQVIQSNTQAQLDFKLSALEKEKDAVLKNKHLTEAQKAKIEEEYQKKANKIKSDAAKKEKAANIIQAIMAGSLAFIKALPNWPLAIATGIASALQIGVIAAQPIPKYAKGRKGGKAEYAIVGEAGREAIQYSDGKTMITPDRASLTFLPAGAKVIPNKELMQMSQTTTFTTVPKFSGNSMSERQFMELKQDLGYGFEMLANVVKNKQEVHLNITEQGIWASVHRGASVSDYINSHIRL